jgi:hypothetical protein
MKIVWLRISLVIFCATQFIGGAFAQSRTVTTEANEPAVQTVAMTDLQPFLNKIPAGRETEYGFRNREEFLRASVETPVQVFTINPDSMRNGIDPKGNYLIPLYEWRVPVVVDGEFRSLITVSMVNNTLKTVELGGESLAKEMMIFWGNEHAGCQALLRLYQLQCDFWILDRYGLGLEHGEFYPFRSARLVFSGLSCSTAHPCFRAEIYPQIKRKFEE